MEKPKVKILGISGSPRRDGNTTGMVKYCLEYAEGMGYAETEFLSLADYDFKPCNGCMKCFGFMAPDDGQYKCYEYDDDIKLIAPKVAECDGLLLGFPIYTGGPPSLFRNFHEKLHHFGPMSFTRWSGALRYKALGLISQGGQVYGGQETNFLVLNKWGSSMGMFNANAWPSREAPMPSSSFSGGMLTTVDGKAVYSKTAWRKDSTRTVPPASGSRNERTLKNLGKQLAVAAMTLKMGRQAFKESGLSEPELIPFTTYSVRPRKGSYADKLVKEGKLKYISKEEIEARKASREKE